MTKAECKTKYVSVILNAWIFSKVRQPQACVTPGSCTCKICVLLYQRFASNCNVKVYQIIPLNYHVHYELSTIHLQFYTEVRLCPKYIWPQPHKPKWILENLFHVWFCITNLKTRQLYQAPYKPQSNWNVCIKIFIIEMWPFLSIKSFCAILLIGCIFSFYNWF